jgi:hypothetical protein
MAGYSIAEAARRGSITRKQADDLHAAVQRMIESQAAIYKAQREHAEAESSYKRFLESITLDS